MRDFLMANATAVFTLLGTVVGGVLSFLASFALRRSELRLRLREKILDRRIEAHEKIVRLAKTMRLMVVLSYDPNTGDLPRAPWFFEDKEKFEAWYSDFSLTSNEASTWLSIKVVREVNLVQDYLVNLHQALKPVAPERYLRLGSVLRDDFIDFSQSLERLAFDFFATDLERFRLNDLREHHKYEPQVTLDRLAKTALRSRSQELTRIAQGAV